MAIVMTGTDRTVVTEDGLHWPAGLPKAWMWFNCEACDNMIGIKDECGFETEDWELIEVAENAGWLLVPMIHEGGFFNGWYETILCPDCVKEQTDEPVE